MAQEASAVKPSLLNKIQLHAPTKSLQTILTATAKHKKANFYKLAVYSTYTKNKSKDTL